MTSAYITPYDYIRGATGQETDSLIGNLTRLASGIVVGATALPLLAATTVALNAYDNITVFDGLSTEVVTVTTTTGIGATSVPVSATLYAHATGTVVCSDGTFGSLADKILVASDMVEDITYQQLLLGSHTDLLSLRSMRASVDNRGALTLRPMNYPVQTVSALLYNAPGSTVTLDASQVFFNAGQQTITVYQLIPSASVPFGNPFQSQLTQRSVGSISLTYTSGYAWGAIPPRIKNAAILLVSDQLSHRDNKSGAFLTQMGKVKTQYAPPTDTSGQSLLYKQACDNLSSWTVEPV